MKPRKPTLAERLAAVPPPLPETIAYLNKLREEQAKKRPLGWTIESIRPRPGLFSDADLKGHLAYIDYNRSRIMEEEYERITGEKL